MRRWLLGGLLGVVALPAAAQHPLPKLHKPLSERVALSDVVVLGRVTSVAPGRLRVERVQALLGEVPGEFEVKRSPLRPGPHQAGDLAVLFLRGARTPYVHVDEAREQIRLEDPADARRLAAAVEELLAAGSDRSRLLALHTRWLGSLDGPLRALAVNAFLLAEPPFGRLSPEAARALARAAADPNRGVGERRASALIAANHDEGLAVLVAWVPGSPGIADRGITDRTLRAGAMRRSPGTADALRRALAHPDPAIRQVGLGATTRRLPFPAPRDMVAKIAENDPDPETRRQAERTLEALDRSASRSGRR